MEKGPAPPSPALSNPETAHGLPSELGNLTYHHDATTSYPRGRASTTTQPQKSSRYSTPVLQKGPYPPPTSHTTYVQPMHLQEPSPYGLLPDENLASCIQPYSTPATSPPTPSRASDVMVTRSGTAIPRGAAAAAPKSSRAEKAAPKRKRARKDRATATKEAVPRLERPLSELMTDSSATVEDIGAYVSRSAEVRQREVLEGKEPGKVKRPMNAFMLYRKAYQNRAKTWCSQHNHQVVSQVCGDSWPLEPDCVRAQFKEWAALERDNHQKAHPGYKFTPSKPSKGKSRRETSQSVNGGGDDGNVSDLDDPDWNGGGGKRRRVARSQTQTPLPFDQTSVDDDDYRLAPRSIFHPRYMLEGGGLPAQNRSTFHFTNPGRLMPAPYDDHSGLPGHYYETTHVPNRHMAVQGTVEDLLMRKTPSPGMAQFSLQPPHHLHHAQQEQPHHHNSLMAYPPPPMTQLDYHSLPPLHPAAAYDPQAQQQLPPIAYDPHAQQQQRIDPSLLQGGEDHALWDQPPIMFPNYLAGNDAVSGAAGVVAPHQVWVPESPYNDVGLQPLGLDETLAEAQDLQVYRGRKGSWQVQDTPAEAEFDNSWLDQQLHAEAAES